MEMTTPSEGETSKREGRRAARAEKKMQREDRKRRETSTLRTSAFISLLTAPPPDREEAEREAAAEFDQAAARSMELLKAAVPDASSPQEAWQTIESRLGPAVDDPMPDLPDHPQYPGDTLVFHQLRRHYGRMSPAGSFRRGWNPGDSLPPMLG